MTTPTAPIRIEGSAELEEGCAKKFQYDVSGQEYPEELVLCRVDGKLHALDSMCPHEGGRLAEGPMWEGRFLHCPLHLYRFDPRDGAAIGVACPSGRTFRVEERAGAAFVWVFDGVSSSGPAPQE